MAAVSWQMSVEIAEAQTQVDVLTQKLATTTLRPHVTMERASSRDVWILQRVITTHLRPATVEIVSIPDAPIQGHATTTHQPDVMMVRVPHSMDVAFVEEARLRVVLIRMRRTMTHWQHVTTALAITLAWVISTIVG